MPDNTVTIVGVVDQALPHRELTIADINVEKGEALAAELEAEPAS